MTVRNKLYFSALLIVLSAVVLPIYNFFSSNSFKLETSVWCLTGSNQTKLCKFRNICYDSEFKTLLFFLSNRSVIKGFNNYSELQKIQLSSVQQHNQFYANLSVIDTRNYTLSKQLRIHSKTLLLSRFKPNNIMHTIHDDIFPIFLTLDYVCSGDIQCIENYSLMFHDNHPEGPFFNLYKLFSQKPPILSSNLGFKSDHILCFEEMLTGLVLDGIFYQYGFKKPHGPLKTPQLTQNDVFRFSSFFKNKLGIYDSVDSISKILLLKRQKNRKVLNIEEVQQMVEKTFEELNKKAQVDVISLDLFSDDFSTLVNLVSQADGLIGMHGAEMILSLFLKSNSFVVEIFPFGIKPEVVSFIKQISELNGSNLLYFSWSNKLRNNSVFHPSAHPLFGGISHLDEVTQSKIKNAVEVPPFECCNNPFFLYYMYQDTLVSYEFKHFFHKSLEKTFIHKSKLKSGGMIEDWLHPYSVFNVSCNFQSDKRLFYATWHPPFNTIGNKLWYSVYLRDEKGLFTKDFATDKTILEVEIPSGIEPKFEMWISAYFISNHFKSPDLYIKC